jgi:ligand-binding sensor domain-containing protein
MLAMAVDRIGGLWVVKKSRVYRFDGQAWTTVLCPYIGKPKSHEAPGLHGIAIQTNGNVWIGGTVYGELRKPWEHEDSIWIVDQEQQNWKDGPPMAPLFKFDGNGWRAFGPSHGLNIKWSIPELDEQGRITIKTSKGYYTRQGETWKSVKEADVIADKRWVLRERKRGLLKGYSQLLFRDGERFVEVRPTGHKTGEVSDVGSEQLASLHLVEDRERGCVWLGTLHGLYRIWRAEQGAENE